MRNGPWQIKFKYIHTFLQNVEFYFLRFIFNIVTSLWKG